MTHLALGQRRLTSCLIHLAPSAVTTSMARLCSRVSSSRNRLEHVLAGALVPDKAAAVVVDDHRDVLVALLVRRLVDADAAHAVEPRGAARGLQLGVDAPAHAAHAVPLDAGELGDRRGGAADRQPRHPVLEVARASAPRAAPRGRPRCARRAPGSAPCRARTPGSRPSAPGRSPSTAWGPRGSPCRRSRRPCRIRGSGAARACRAGRSRRCARPRCARPGRPCGPDRGEK